MRNSHGRFAGGRGFRRTLTAQSGRLVHDVQDIGRAAVDGAGKAMARLRAKGRKAMKSVQQARLRVRRYVDANPVKSILVALGTGAIVGFLLRRRRRPD